MRRDLGGELLVAAAVIVMLTTALTFGVLLSATSNEPDTTESDADSVAQAATATGALSSVVNELTDTDEPIETSVSTSTPSPSDEPTETVTPSDVPQDPTVTAEPTETSVLTATPGSTDKPIETSIATNRLVPNQVIVRGTDGPTATDQPSRTPRPTMTATNTATPTPTWTHTATATEEPTATDRPTRTPSPTLTPTITPIPVTLVVTDLGIVPTPTPTLTPTASVCVPPTGWVPYTVERGVTLFLLSLAVGSDVPTLQAANCLLDPNDITAGTDLYVPRPPGESPLFRLLRDDRVPVGCVSPAFQIISPGPGDTFTDSFDVIGTAAFDAFGYYNLEIRPDEQTNYNFLLQSQVPVVEGVLGRVDRSLFPAGQYWVRLVVVDQRGTIPTDGTCAIPVIFE
jgi:LysM repeat protein